ncbi:meiotically up-regulated protein [Perilla frutescens var. frutescens]|nr:meiotically up-regulated protein [Perilla frutescens var. frutescens]
MNCEVCQLKELDVEHFEIREVLRCILHTILFHRALGLVRPKDIDLELFEITYVQCGEVELERKIDEKIDQFIDRVEKHPNKKNQICLSFFEVKNKQPTWFTNKVERLYWEQWYINLNVAQHPKGHSGKSNSSKIVVDPGAEERTARRAALEASLRDVLFQIIRFVNEKKDHIPPIPNLEGVSFPYEITISRFCIWNGNVQEDAPNGASDYAQLTTEAPPGCLISSFPALRYVVQMTMLPVNNLC